MRSRVLEKTRSEFLSRSRPRTRRISRSWDISDCWATINQNADGVTLSYLVDDNNLNTVDKIVLLDGAEQPKGYIVNLYGSSKYIYHTELSLEKGKEYTITLPNRKTKTILLPDGELKLAYVSDLHYLANPETTNSMFERVKETNPDYILCGGDWVLDDTASAGGHQWVNFIEGGLPILNEDRIMPFLIPTIGNHDHIGTGRGIENGIGLRLGWFGYPEEVQYLHDVFPFDSGQPTVGYGLADLTDDVSVFVTDFCTNDILGDQIEWFKQEASLRSDKKNIFVSHLQLFPSDRPREILTPFLRDHYFPTIYDYFQLGLDGHDHSLATTKPIIDVDNQETGEGGVRFYGQGGMSDKWYDGSQAGSWYMDEVILRQNHFHLLEYDGTDITVTPIDKDGESLWSHTINRTTKQ